MNDTTQSRGYGRTATSTGISLGAAIGASVSWSIHHSLLWAWLHGMAGWFYVIAYALEWTDQWVPK